MHMTDDKKRDVEVKLRLIHRTNCSSEQACEVDPAVERRRGSTFRGLVLISGFRNELLQFQKCFLRSEASSSFSCEDDMQPDVRGNFRKLGFGLNMSA